MNSAFKFMIGVIAHAINGAEPLEPPKDIDWGAFLNLVYRHDQICTVADYPQLLCGMPKAILDKFLKDAKVQRTKEHVRNISLHNLFDKLEENDLYSMPIKGFVIKDLYPKPYMRMMGDIDLFIKKEQLPEVHRVLEEMGYVYDHTSTHEVVYNLDPFINLEVHTQLSADYYDGINAEYEGAWDRAVPISEKGFQCRMTPEDLYIHSTAHFALHYCTAGGGVRPVIDLWLQRRRLESMADANIDYVNAELEKLGFKTFEDTIYRLAEVWFEGKSHTFETERTERIIMSGTAYGSTEGYTALRFYRVGENEKNPLLRRAKVLLSVMFMKPATLRVKYPGLNKRPYLYPFYTVYRWAEILSRRGDEVKRMANVAFHSSNAEYEHAINDIIENNKALGFKKNFFDKKFYD